MSGVRLPSPVNAVVFLFTTRPKKLIAVPYLTRFRKMSRILAIITISVIIFLLGIFSFLKINSRPVSTDRTNTMFVINSGDGLIKISQKLESNSLIRNQYVFLFNVYTSGLKNKIQAGTFRLSPSLSTKEIVIKLSKGGVNDYWLKIIGGTRTEEIATLFPTDVPFVQKDFLKQSKIKEGYLFPDSYLIPKYYTIDQILEIIQKNFNQKFNQAKEGATNKKMTDQEILVFASIIEREARTLAVKQGVAGVLLNRISIGMPLQSDVTIQYVRDSLAIRSLGEGWKNYHFWQDLAAADISIVSPFNTYKNKGLPPSPICNPGYDSLYAAFHPIDSDNLFYLTGNDGVMHYAKTLQEHNSNIAKYLN